MKNIVGIKFKEAGKTYSFNAENLQLKKHDRVVVDTDNGLTIGIVVSDVKPTPVHKLPDNLKNVIRKTTEEDLQIREENQKFEQEAFRFCLAKIKEKNLPMKLINVECLLDKSKTIFYFTAENRVDFRELVKNLVQKFRTRIELRQIGTRNGTRILGGIGACGREICCATFLYNFDRVSIKMAKEQALPLNPVKISGACGRLMCCLAYEQEQYLAAKAKMPRMGKQVSTPAGMATVTGTNPIKETVLVELESGVTVELPLKDIS